jgi:cobalt-zinc-cadmium efflux system protein
MGQENQGARPGGAHSHHTPHTHHAHHGTHSSVQNIKVAFFLNIAFTILEVAGGLYTNSMAILSDALHDLGDTFALSLAWLFEKYSQRREDARYTFGYRRFSMLGALANSLLLLAGSAVIIARALPRLFAPQPANARGMLVFALVGILVNGAAALRLRRGQTLNEKMVSWHLLEDVLGWAAVLVVSVVLLFADLPRLDPILSLVITVYVLVNVLRNTRTTLQVLLQSVPQNIDMQQVRAAILDHQRVRSVHHIHAWSLDGMHHVLSAHVVVADETSREEIVALKGEIKERIRAFSFAHLTLEMEYESEYCRQRDDEQAEC